MHGLLITCTGLMFRLCRGCCSKEICCVGQVAGKISMLLSGVHPFNLMQW